MEDIVQIRLLFVAGLLVMSGVVVLLAYAGARVGDWVRGRMELARPTAVRRRPVKNIPVRGTR